MKHSPNMRKDFGIEKFFTISHYSTVIRIYHLLEQQTLGTKGIPLLFSLLRDKLFKLLYLRIILNAQLWEQLSEKLEALKIIYKVRKVFSKSKKLNIRDHEVLAFKKMSSVLQCSF